MFEVVLCFSFPMHRYPQVFALIALPALLVSCQNGKLPLGGGSGVEDPYVSSYPSDGGYNPYPNQPGRVAGRVSEPSYETPVAPAEADPYAFHAPSNASSGSVRTSPPISSTPVKSTGSSRPKGTVANKTTAAKASSYKVSKGDTLYGIALKNKTTVAKLKSLNGLSSDLIRPGQRLKLR